MDIYAIQKCIEKIPEDGEFFLSEETLASFSFVTAFLKNYFSVDKLLMKAIKKHESNLSFSGNAESFDYLGNTYEKTNMAISFEEDCEKIVMKARFDFQPNKGVLFLLHEYLQWTEGSVECTGRYREDQETGKESFRQKLFLNYSGESSLELWLQPVFKNEWSLWLYEQDASERSLFKLETLLSIVGDSELKDWLPEKIRRACEQIAVTEFSMLLNAAENEEGCEAFTVEFMSDRQFQWQIFGGLTVQNVRIGILRQQSQKENDDGTAEEEILWNVWVKGDFTFGEREVPVCVGLSASGKVFQIMIGGDEKILIGSLNDLKSLTGYSMDINAYLPTGYVPLNLYMRTVDLEVNLSENTVGKFEFCIGLQAGWTLFGILNIQELEFLFRHEPSSDFYMLTGRLEFAGLNFLLEVQKEAEKWFIYGRLSDEDAVCVNDFLKACGCSALLPDFVLNGICFQCSPAENSYGFCAATTLGEKTDSTVPFQYLTASFDLSFYKEDGTWKWKGNIDGRGKLFGANFSVLYAYNPENTTNQIHLTWIREEDFSLTEFLFQLGVRGTEDFEVWGITLQKMELEYNFENNDFTGTLQTNLGSAFLCCEKNPETGQEERVFVAGFQTELGFSKLPLVGESIPALKAYNIDRLGAVISEKILEQFTVENIVSELTVGAGCYLFAHLSMGDETSVLCLPLTEMKTGAAAGVPALKQGARDHGTLLTAGPFVLNQIVLGYREYTLWAEFSAKLALDILSISLNGLAFGWDIRGKRIRTRLDGLGFSLSSKSISLEGSFFEKDKNTYAGTLGISFSNLRIQAAGAYQAGELSSAFAMGALFGEIGGPPCFTVKGIGVGFGYQRRLVIPKLESLGDFPMMKVLEPGADMAAVANEAAGYFEPEGGSLWLAAGIRGISFGMVDICALLAVYLAKNIEIYLLGRARMDFPQKAEDPLAHSVLKLNASVNPETGLVLIEGMLSDDSYVLSKNAHLTGAFALAAWFSGEHSGDFVISFGGYAQCYERPAHYPNPQRIGIVWSEGDELLIQGEAYFAITPACMMAGGNLHLDLNVGVLHAWLDAAAAVFIGWKPLYYEMSLQVAVGVSVKLGFLKMTLELGCSLELWGPDLSGKAEINLGFLSFTVNFGSAVRGAKSKLTVPEFAEEFLCENDKNGCLFSAGKVYWKNGILSEVEEKKGEEKEEEQEKIKIISAEAMELEIRCRVPMLSWSVILGEDQTVSGASGLGTLTLRPCGDEKLGKSAVSVTLSRKDGKAVNGKVSVFVQQQRQPSALWAEEAYLENTILCDTGLLIKMKPHENWGLTAEADCYEKERKEALRPLRMIKKVYATKENAKAALQKMGSDKACRQRVATLKQWGIEAADIDLNENDRWQDIFCCMPQVFAVKEE